MRANIFAPRSVGKQPEILRRTLIMRTSCSAKGPIGDVGSKTTCQYENLLGGNLLGQAKVQPRIDFITKALFLKIKYI